MIGINLHYLNSGFSQKFFSQRIRIAGLVINLFNTGVNNHASTDGTWLVGAVDNGTVDGYTMVSGLYNGVLFCMNTSAQFMHYPGFDIQLFPQATDLQAMFQTGGRAVIAS